MSRTSPQSDAEELYIYSREDIEQILGDAFVDMREVCGDRDAAEAIDIIYEELTDDFHGHTR